MNECCSEGDLRAYLDRELPPDTMAQLAIHLGGCAGCHTRYNGLAARASTIASWMAELRVEPSSAPAVPQPQAAPRRTLGAAVLALAATAALAFIAFPKRTEVAKPAATPRIAPIRPIVSQTATPQPNRLQTSVPRPKPAKREKPPEVQYYLALDDEPIEMGTVMRVALDDAGTQADVIFDADGRPRAIRTVK